MKFSAVTALLLGGAAVNAQVMVIEEGLYNISNATATVTKAIKGFSLTKLDALTADNAAALSAINVAIARITPIDPITLMDAVVLTPIINMLVNGTQESVNATIDKKPVFGGLVPVVQQNLMQQLNASNYLNLAIAAKLPKSLLAISAAASAPIAQSLNTGIDVFSKPIVNTPESDPELFAPRPQPPNYNVRTSAAGLSTAPSRVAAGLVAVAVAAVTVGCM